MIEAILAHQVKTHAHSPFIPSCPWGRQSLYLGQPLPSPMKNLLSALLFCLIAASCATKPKGPEFDWDPQRKRWTPRKTASAT